MSIHGIKPEGFRLPDETRLGPVRLQVSDLTRSLDYYQRVLGLTVVSAKGDVASLGAAGGAAGGAWADARSLSLCDPAA